MKIIDLTSEHEKQYFCCLEDWSDEVKEAGDHKACWYNKIKDKGLKVKLAQDENGVIGGMIQYLPVEHSLFEGRDLYVVLCIWIHGHKKGIGNFQKKGMGKALLKAAEEDVKSIGAKGLVTWGVILPFFMRASWFKKQGYSVVDKDGIMRLLWKPFSREAMPPSFIKQKKKPQLIPGKVTVSLFLNGWCTTQNMTYERTKRAIGDFKDKIEINEYPTFEKDIQREWGISDAVFINRKKIWGGPPPSYKKIRRLVEKEVKMVK
ncbi:MAG: GNAT family N-acetyltransferase [Bacteroidales bacterium]